MYSFLAFTMIILIIIIKEICVCITGGFFNTCNEKVILTKKNCKR